MGLVDLVKPRELPLTDVVPRSDTASDLGGFTMDSPWIHPVAEADDMAFAWATAKTNSLTGCF
jgi:hypothetical protein